MSMRRGAQVHLLLGLAAGLLGAAAAVSCGEDELEALRRLAEDAKADVAGEKAGEVSSDGQAGAWHIPAQEMHKSEVAERG